MDHLSVFANESVYLLVGRSLEEAIFAYFRVVEL